MNVSKMFLKIFQKIFLKLYQTIFQNIFQNNFLKMLLKIFLKIFLNILLKNFLLKKQTKVGDIGMIPSENLRDTFVEFARQNHLFSRSTEMGILNEKVAYVLPTYEIRTENSTPKSKKELQGKYFKKCFKK